MEKKDLETYKYFWDKILDLHLYFSKIILLLSSSAVTSVITLTKTNTIQTSTASSASLWFFGASILSQVIVIYFGIEFYNQKESDFRKSNDAIEVSKEAALYERFAEWAQVISAATLFLGLLALFIWVIFQNPDQI